MSELNVEWALRELEEFISLSTTHSNGGYTETLASEDEITPQAEVVERILNRIIPNWRAKIAIRSSFESQWKPLRDMCIRAHEILKRRDEISENLGDNAPRVSASDFHSWVWSGAESLWQSGHYREAVEGAIRKINAETQNKLGRRDLSETKLFNEAFSENPPAVGKPRLHRMSDDGSDTFKSVQRGARTFAEGVFAGIRNPLAHEVDVEMSQQQALEYLAALSILARWVDGSTLEVAR
ncbi:TIGR02391 family protein [Bifidobacterium tibiigranuli]|jgi:hypothetical protein|uniref:TIGR02391 family protein n=1 Tax=Bifidobacterium tibiigranuli TaxID=2172043 RepID=UPI0026F25722|nr:TIGR02391 family protein [Bifidobacterium tibiigranuli]MCI1712649.1 TIGR02391 family protein [Bifidobacterium tibiigranuli]